MESSGPDGLEDDPSRRAASGHGDSGGGTPPATPSDRSPAGSEDSAAEAAWRSAELRARLRNPVGPATATHPEIVYLDPRGDRPVSQYSPEGEIRMMGEFAAGLSRSKSISRPMAWGLVLVVVLPIVISVLAVVLGH